VAFVPLRFKSSFENFNGFETHQTSIFKVLEIKSPTLKISLRDKSKFALGARAKADTYTAAKVNKMSTCTSKGKTGPFVNGFTSNPIRYRTTVRLEELLRGQNRLDRSKCLM